jgi:hypothetical protein
MTKFLSASLVCLLVFGGCTGKSSEGISSIPEEITLEERMAPLMLEKEKEFQFNLISKEGPSLIRVDDKDHLYVSVLQNEDGDCEIFKYGSSDFKLKARCVIRRGQGPQEALNPRDMGGDASTIIIYDAMGLKYIQYNSNFDYINEYRVKNIGDYGNSGGIYVPKNRMVVDYFMLTMGIDPVGGHCLFARDFYNSRDTKLFEIKAPLARKIAGKLVFTISKPLHFTFLNEHYYILDKKDYRIIKMNIEGQIVKDIKIKCKPIAAPESSRKKWLAMTIKNNRDKRLLSHVDYAEYVYTALWIVPFAEGALVGRCKDHSPDNKGPVMADYYDEDLNYHGQVELPYFESWNNPASGNAAAVTLLHYIDRKLYFVDIRDNDEYWITLWNVKSKTM